MIHEVAEAGTARQQPICEWIDPPLEARSQPFILGAADGAAAGAGADKAFVRLGAASESTAREFLDAGAAGVLLGDTAVREAALVERLVAAYGGARIGVAIEAARLEIAWRLDNNESNADFKVMRPSHVEPDWEIILSGGARTGALVAWWLSQMFDRGIARAVIGVEVTDDADLNILAGLSEAFGERIALEGRPSVRTHLDQCAKLCGLSRVVVPWSDRALWTTSSIGEVAPE